VGRHIGQAFQLLVQHLSDHADLFVLELRQQSRRPIVGHECLARRVGVHGYTQRDVQYYSRVDIRIDDIGNPYVPEINSMASLGASGFYVRAAFAADYTYETLVIDSDPRSCEKALFWRFGLQRRRSRVMMVCSPRQLGPQCGRGQRCAIRAKFVHPSSEARR
jgi:hypothetical protein